MIEDVRRMRENSLSRQLLQAQTITKLEIKNTGKSSLTKCYIDALNLEELTDNKTTCTELENK